MGEKVMENPTGQGKRGLISAIRFRDKRNGWKEYTSTYQFMDDKRERKDFFLHVETMRENLYLKGFLKNLYLRPICYKCPYKSLRNESDITIGDFWGIENILPEFDDNKGVSLVMINNKKGEELYRGLQVDSVDSSFEIACLYGPCIEKSVRCPKKRTKFMSGMNEGSIFRLLKILTKPSLLECLKKLIRIFLLRLGLLSIIRNLLWKYKKRRLES
jgi:hypothetical protein